MRITKKSVKNATALVENDIIDIAGVKYRVVENAPSTFTTHKRNLTLTTVSNVSDDFGDRVFIIMPSFLPMTIYKKSS